MLAACNNNSVHSFASTSKLHMRSIIYSQHSQIYMAKCVCLRKLEMVVYGWKYESVCERVCGAGLSQCVGMREWGNDNYTWESEGVYSWNMSVREWKKRPFLSPLGQLWSVMIQVRSLWGCFLWNKHIVSRVRARRGRAEMEDRKVVKFRAILAHWGTIDVAGNATM